MRRARPPRPARAGTAAEEERGPDAVAAVIPPAPGGVHQHEHDDKDNKQHRDDGAEARPAVIVVVVVVAVVIVPAAVVLGRAAAVGDGAGAAVELVRAVELGKKVHKVGEERRHRLVVLPGVGIRPEVLVHERVCIAAGHLIRDARADGQPAAILLDYVQQKQAVVGAGAADAPAVEEQVRVLLGVVARGQVVDGDDHYLRPVAVLLQRAAGVEDQVLGGLAQRPRAVVDVEVRARLRHVRGKGAEGHDGQEQQGKYKGKDTFHPSNLLVTQSSPAAPRR